MGKKPEWKKAAQRREMEDIWKSHEWQIKERLISIDNMARAMIEEMKTFSVPHDMIAEYLPRQFEALRAEVVTEQIEKYDGPKSRVG